MDIFFVDPNEVPLPAAEVRIRQLQVEPWADGRRLHVELEVDPSQKHPNADLLVHNLDGELVASTSIIESITRRMEVNLHLRGAPPGKGYQLTARLYFVDIPAPEEEPSLEDIQPLVVDERQIEFEIPIVDENPAG